MLRRIAFVLFVGAVAALYIAFALQTQVFFFVVPLMFLCLCYAFFIADHFMAIGTASFISALTLIELILLPNATHATVFLLTCVLFLGVILYVRRWNLRISEAEARKALVKKDAGAIHERYEARMESLFHLEQRVCGLSKLFEIARDFNECLSFSDLLNVLDQKISDELHFDKGTIALLTGAPESKKRVSQVISFGQKKREDQRVAAKFAELCLQRVREGVALVKIELVNPSEQKLFEPCGASRPLWIFPLVVEQQTIAVLIIEGGHVNDLPSFELLASQLALQVKKIGLYERVRELSIVDGLTKVFVRRHFMERFREELKRAVRYKFALTVLMVDIDDFKSYNDRFGHLVGDRTLREVVRVIQGNLRPVDVIGRFGGEEFIVVAPEVEKTKGLELAERVRSSVARHRFRIYDEDTRVTISVGTSSFPEHAGSEAVPENADDYAEELIQKSDQALYRAKEEGRNRVVEFSEGEQA
jgi:diguanylate cyclase (GGDEF)-like protein